MSRVDRPELWKAIVETDPDIASDEFPHREPISDLSRRDLLKVMGGSLALAGLAGCRGAFLPQRHLVPYVDQPEEIIPGEFLYYRTATVRAGHAFGLHVATREGRPIKIEGNPDHPASKGACDPVSMAEMLAFYDPDRARSVTRGEREMGWDDFEVEFHRVLRESRGEGVRILTGATSSPTLVRQIADLRAAYPGLRWHVFEPLDRSGVYEGSRLALGKPMAPVCHPGRASVILLVDYDFDRPEFGAYRIASELIEGRTDGRINRIYSVHTVPGLAIGFADHSRPLAPSQVRKFLADLLAGSSDDPWTSAVIADLKGAQGRAIVLAGEYLSSDEHAACCLLNDRLAAPVDYLPPITQPADGLSNLVGDMNAGRVQALLISDVNPVYSASPELGFAEALRRVPLTASHSRSWDETAMRSTWRLPATHFFEHWTDALAFDGTATIAQPLIEPLFDGRSLHQLLARMLEDPLSPLEIVRGTWREKLVGDTAWQEAVRSGVVPETSVAPKPMRANGAVHLGTPSGQNGIEVNVRPDRFMLDGSYANNGWLQELPRPVTEITWDNPIELSPNLAQKLNVENGDHLSVGGLVGPAWITPGHPDQAVTVFLGFGRQTGTVASGVGFNAFQLLSAGTGFTATAQVKKENGNTEVATIQRFTNFAGRDPIHEYAFNEIPKQKDLGSDPTLYELTDQQEKTLPSPQWGMSIDLNRCVGCGACVAACVAENNISVVGRDQVIMGRHMHWIRVDTYHSGPTDNPRTFFQPLPCMQCETAPCEPVCPVAATVHSHEGLNQMIYNRCVGTRYCSNNCPYKVRRFNFMNYQLRQPNFRDHGVQLLRLLNNPDVTVRSRGVMEKCTYCVQRIDRVRIKAKEQDRPIREGEILTACQQACPTGAIVFGNLADRATRARKLRDDERTYALLQDLNTRPRTTYLSKLRNANPDLPEQPNA